MRELFHPPLIPIKVDGTDKRMRGSCQNAIKMDDKRRNQSVTVPEGHLL
jgi:hypothetical protein